MAKYRKVIRTGNSLCLTIPSKVISDFDIKEGDIASIKINRSRASITCIFTGHPRQLSLIGNKANK